ncbi:MAG: rhodanese-like domain-containing protein [Coriobacteriia bacterium]|nr:rhodanese-like domain-containing protein [Coriobacteriia bacterium]
MGLFDTSMDDGVQEWRSTPGAVLLDVRTDREYQLGHVPGCVHVPIDQLQRVLELVPDAETPLFVYCLSGSRSGQAVRVLQQVGYVNARNIGGVSTYKGDLEPGE